MSRKRLIRMVVGGPALLLLLVITAPARADIIGFDNGVGWTTNRSHDAAAFSGNSLLITGGGPNAAGSAWFNVPQAVTGFTASFTYQQAQIGAFGSGEGMAFVFQNAAAGVNALGGTGGFLGYSGISPSAAFEINLDGLSSIVGIGMYVNGATGAIGPDNGVPTGSVDLLSQDPIQFSLKYDNAAHTMSASLKDSIAGTSFFDVFTNIDIPLEAGGSNALVGFTGSTFDPEAAKQVVSDFSFINSGGNAVPEPTSLTLLGIGALGMAGYGWRRTNRRLCF